MHLPHYAPRVIEYNGTRVFDAGELNVKAVSKPMWARNFTIPTSLNNVISVLFSLNRNRRKPRFASANPLLRQNAEDNLGEGAKHHSLLSAVIQSFGLSFEIIRFIHYCIRPFS